MGYKDQPELWVRDAPRFPGDVRSRPGALKLLDAQPGELVFDAGCGTGYMSRQLARQGVRVVGCDVSAEMLEQAKRHPDRNAQLEDYYQVDVVDIWAHGLLRSMEFDRVFCCAVLIHCDIDTVTTFVTGARLILKPGGVLVISVTHPFCYTEISPTRTGQVPWQVHRADVPGLPYDRSQQFHEDYMDCDGTVFACSVWHHPLTHYFELLAGAGFWVTALREVLWTAEDAAYSPYWAGAVGFPGWLQIRAIKLK